MRLTIGRRIVGLVLLLLVLLIGSGFATSRAIDDVAEAMALRRASYQTTLALGELQLTIADAEIGQRGYVLTGESSYLLPYQAAVDGLDPSMRRVDEMISDDVQQANVSRLGTLVAVKRAELQRSVDLRRDQGFEAALAVIRSGEGKKAMDDIRDALRTIAARQDSLLEQRSLQAEQSVRNARYVQVVAVVASSLLALVAGYLVSRSITRPIGELVDGTVRIGSGDLDHRILVRGDDETGELATAFNAMVGRLKAAEVRMQAEATQREKVLAAVTDTAQQLAAASQELLAGATEQASGMQQQAAAVAETVTVVDEVAHTATQAAERAKFVATAARRSEEVGGAGKRAVDETIAVINTAKTDADAVAEKIASLATQTQAIGEIVALINDIADQTNLLALNAAIEASRAGEHGRGFSVVATEVKALADESKQATRRVRQILGDIQNMANKAVLSTEDGTRGMTLASRKAEAAGMTIQALGDVIAEVAEAASQIAASAGQQATGLTQIHQAMRDIKQVSAQNLAATHQAQRAASDLSTLGINLKALLSGSSQSNG